MRIERAWNPIALCHDPVVLECPEWLSPNEIIRHHQLVFSRPVMCMVNGRFWSRNDWDCIVPAGGEVRFVELPMGGGGSNPLRMIATIGLMLAASFVPGMLGLTGLAGSLLSAGIMIGGTLLLNMLFPVAEPSTPDYGTPKSIYSVTGSGNRLRIGEPFAEHFGRMLCFPDLAQVSYTNIRQQEQYLYFLGFIGVGEYDIEGVYIDQTPIGDYIEATYSILGPGHIPSIVTHVVWSSAEISGQELSTAYLTAVVSAAGTSALHIEYDLLFSQLVAYNDQGDKRSASVTVVADVRLVDQHAAPLGDWVGLHQRTYTAASIDALRYSNKVAVPLGPGRYEFRIRRTTEPSADSKTADRVSVIGLRAYGGKHPQYGNVTMIEAKIKATDQLNGDVASKIRVVATRKLQPLTDTGLGSTPVATRSIIDAIAYFATSANGGMQDNSFLHFDVLAALKTKLDTMGHWFDWRFSSRTTVMEACVKAARCGRSVPYMPGGQLAVVRDEYQELPKMVFTDDDFDADSLAVTTTFPTVDAPTCVRIRYVDGDTWQDEEVVYYDERGSDLIPYDVSLEGCTVRQQAWEMASYLYRDMMSNTTSVEWPLGLKGHLPSFFNKVAIAETSVDWGQNGRIVAVEPGLIWLSEPVDFKGGNQGKILITAPMGNAEGPYTVTEVAGNPYCVAGEIEGLRTLQDDDLLATSYLFGPAAVEPLYVRVMGIHPQGRNKVRLIGTIVTDSVYDSPGAVAEPGSSIPASDPLVSISLVYKGVLEGDNEFSALWVGAAVKYRIELDSGGGWVVLEDNHTMYQLTFTTAANAISVRVTPYTVNTLLPDAAQTVTYTVVPAPSGLVLDNADAYSVEVSWSAVANADSYDVSIWVDEADRGGRSVTATSASITTTEMSALGGPWPEFDVHVRAVVGVESGPDAVLAVSIPPMAAPAGLALQSVLSNGVMLSWGAVAGATGYRVYVGTTAGFDPETDGVMVYAGQTASCVAVVDVTTPYDHYFKVAGTNGYYQDAAYLVFCAALNVTG